MSKRLRLFVVLHSDDLFVAVVLPTFALSEMRFTGTQEVLVTPLFTGVSSSEFRQGGPPTITTRLSSEGGSDSLAQEEDQRVGATATVIGQEGPNLQIQLQLRTGSFAGVLFDLCRFLSRSYSFSFSPYFVVGGDLICVSVFAAHEHSVKFTFSLLTDTSTQVAQEMQQELSFSKDLQACIIKNLDSIGMIHSCLCFL